MSRALIAIAKMKIVIATNSKLTALSNPVVMFIELFHDVLYAVRPAWVFGPMNPVPGASDHNISLIVHMIKATTINAAKAIPIIMTTPRSTTPCTLSFRLRIVILLIVHGA